MIVNADDVQVVSDHPFVPCSRLSTMSCIVHSPRRVISFGSMVSGATDPAGSIKRHVTSSAGTIG